MPRLNLGLWMWLSLATVLRAGDWPQILGPERNAVALNEQLADQWPASGPRVLWRKPLGSGYAGVAVVDNRAIAFHRMDNSERVECFDVVGGKSLWKADFAARYRGGVDADLGPRCVPLIAGDAVYVFGAAGDLHALDLATGKARWSRELYADYGGDEGYFGAGSTPILLGSKLLVNVGGRGAGIVAVEAATGKTAWKVSDEGASYSSPVAARIDDQVRALFITRMSCIAVDPHTGRLTTLFPFGKRGPTVNAAGPQVLSGRVFVTASYGVGAVLAPLADKSQKALWSNDESLSSQYSTPVVHGGFLYGIHGREDQGVAELRCVELASGRVQWQQKNYGVAHLILAGDKLILQRADGRLSLAIADSKKYRELATAQVTPSPIRALPALASGRLYIRTGSGGGELICLEVGDTR